MKVISKSKKFRNPNRDLVVAESAATDAGFSDSDIEFFAEGLWDEINDEYGWGSRIDREALTAIVENCGLGRGWNSYGSDDFGATLALNVKGYGAGNWNKFNSGGRAEKAGLDIGSYSQDVIGGATESFYNSWNERFEKEFGLTLRIMGRSGGHWGFSLKDMLHGDSVFMMQKQAVTDLYNKMLADPEIDDEEDFSSWAAENEITSSEDIAKYVTLNPKFIEELQNFEDSVSETSEQWASDDFNDQEFANYADNDAFADIDLVSEADENDDSDEPESIDVDDKDDTDDNAEIEVKDDNDYTKKLIDFGSKMLLFGVESHLWHLNCESNAEHLTLKELYEGCDDLGDKLLEAALGISGGYIENRAANKEYDFGDLRYNEGCIGKIRDMENEAKDLIDSCDDAGIENILADFCELCNSVVYKLKRLK